MSTSTTASEGIGRKAKVFLAALAVASAGLLGLASSNANADGGIQVEFDKGALNLGAAFQGKEVLPSPARSAYWWNAFDSGVANAAAEGFADKLAAVPSIASFYTDQINVCPEKYGTTGATTGDATNDMFPCTVNPKSASVGATETALNVVPAFEGSGAPANANGVIAVQNWPGAYDGANCAATLGAINPLLAALCWPTLAVPFTQSTYNSTTGAVSFQANAVRFPVMIVPSPVDGSPVPITVAVSGAPFLPALTDGTPAGTAAAIAANDAIEEIKVSGTYDRESGAMSLTGPLEARVVVGAGRPEANGGPTPFLYCAIPLPGITLDTTGGSTADGKFPGTPYYYPELLGTTWLPGDGALAGSWNVTADSTLVHRTELDPGGTVPSTTNCNTVNTVVKGAGALWLGSGDVDVPVCAEDEVGSYPDCAKAETDFAKPTLKVKKSVKGGKKLSVTVKVKNNGNVEGTANVRVQTSNGKVKAPTLAVKVAVDPGKTGSKTVKLATKKGSKGKVTVYATTNDKTGKATTKVK